MSDWERLDNRHFDDEHDKSRLIFFTPRIVTLMRCTLSELSRFTFWTDTTSLCLQEKQAEISFKKCPVLSIFDDNNLEPSKDKRETKSAPQPVTPFMSLESVGQDLKTKQEAKEDEKPESSPAPDGVEFRRSSTPSPFDTGDPPSGHGEPSIYLSIYLSIDLSIYLSIYRFSWTRYVCDRAIPYHGITLWYKYKCWVYQSESFIPKE